MEKIGHKLDGGQPHGDRQMRGGDGAESVNPRVLECALKREETGKLLFSE